MAEIVLGVASSHTPQVSSGVEWWAGHAQRDERNPFLVGIDGQTRSFEELVELAPAGLDKELDPAVWEDKFGRAQKAIAVLGEELAAAAPDIVVVVGDDQRELFEDEGNPAIGLCVGTELWDRGLTEERKRHIPEDVLPAQWAAHAAAPDPYPVAQDLSRHLAATLTDAGFDITVFSEQAPGRTLGHAFTFLRRRLGLPASVPIVPVALNTYYPPNVPLPARCWSLGLALASALESWTGAERIAVAASGGLSHFVINEELDHLVLDGLARGDGERLGAIPKDHLRSGNSEILNWIVAGGMLAERPMEVVDYIPAYRSLAGTGCGMGFATWGGRGRSL
jgi:3-O-methylgallate 3,4-dioxygenase